MQKNPAAPEPEAPVTNQATLIGNICRADLTEREREVLEELVTGVSNQIIARRMNLSVDTVKYHLKNLLSKTGCKTRTELAVKACLGGILPPEEYV